MPLYIWRPHMFCCLHIFGCPLYVWTPPYIWTVPICLDVPHTFGASYIWGVFKYTGGSHTYGEHPAIQRGVQTEGECKHMGVFKHTGGHPNIWGVSKHMGHQTYGAFKHTWGASKHMGASKCMGQYGHPLSLTKHAFFVLFM